VASFAGVEPHALVTRRRRPGASLAVDSSRVQWSSEIGPRGAGVFAVDLRAAEHGWRPDASPRDNRAALTARRVACPDAGRHPPSRVAARRRRTDGIACVSPPAQGGTGGGTGADPDSQRGGPGAAQESGGRHEAGPTTRVSGEPQALGKRHTSSAARSAFLNRRTTPERGRTGSVSTARRAGTTGAPVLPRARAEMRAVPLVLNVASVKTDTPGTSSNAPGKLR